MSAGLRLAAAGMLRAPGRTLVRLLVLASAVALLGAMLLFVGHSLRTMTGSAIRSVPLDWQGPVASYAQARNVAAGVARQPGIQQASATATGPFTAASHTGSAGVTNAGNGSILAVPPDYLSHIKTFQAPSRVPAPRGDCARPAARGDAPGPDRGHGHHDPPARAREPSAFRSPVSP